MSKKTAILIVLGVWVLCILLDVSLLEGVSAVAIYFLAAVFSLVFLRLIK